MITVGTFKGKVAPKLHGTTLSKIAGVYDKMQEASGMFLANVRPYSVIRSFRIENAIYDHIYNYACADDIYIDGVIDIRPIGRRSSKDSLDGTFNQEFDIKKAENTFVIEEINGIKTLRLSKCLTPRITLQDMNSLDNLTVAGDAQNLRLDYVDYISGSASVKFDLTGDTGQGIINITFPSVFDLSRYEGQGAIFPWLSFLDTTKLNNVKIRIGNDAGDYYESVVTTAMAGAFVSDAWMLLIEDLKTATKVGTPDFTAVNWMQIEINYDSGTAQTANIDNITAAIGQAWEVIYYSKYMFTDTTGLTWKDTPTVDTDIIRLDDPTDITAFLYTFMLTLQQEIKGKNMAADFSYFSNELNGLHARNGVEVQPGLYEQIMNKYPNQAVIRITTYYEFGDEEESGENDYDVSQAPPFLPSSNGQNFATQSVTASASGNNVQIDLTTLANPYRIIQFVTRNGQILDMGIPGVNDYSSKWSRSGDILTVYNASISDSFLIGYSY